MNVLDGKIACGMQHFKVGLHLNPRKRDEDIPETKVLKPDDDMLLELCKRGDSAAQKSLYDRLAPKMFPICIRYMGDRTAAEDVLQDGFVTLFSKLGSFSGTGSFEGWARKIFVNTALMSIRKSDILKDTDDIDTAWSVHSEGTSALEDLGYKELLRMIGELPVGFRTVFNMYVLEGYSHKDIAEALGITENTSRSQLQRARVALQEKIRNRNK